MVNLYASEGTLLNQEENRAAMESLDTLACAMREGRILEGVAVRCQDLTLFVELGEFTGIIEHDEVQLTDGSPIKDIAVITRVGKPVCFKILSIERPRVGAPVIRLSRRLAQLECAERYLSRLCPGDVIPARVTHLEQFGAFVDLGCGIVSLLSIDAISVSRIAHPSDRMSIGSELDVVVRGMERDISGLPSRLYVSRRELLGTWEENAALFEIGQTVTGIVRSVEPYGIFVELTPNLAGLAEYRDGVSVGQTAAVYIKNIVPERMKIKLVIIDTYRAPHRKSRELRSSLSSGQKSHIDRWRYSPECCDRVVETVFC